MAHSAVYFFCNKKKGTTSAQTVSFYSDMTRMNDCVPKINKIWLIFQQIEEKTKKKLITAK